MTQLSMSTAGAGADAPAPTPWQLRLRDVGVRYPNGTVALQGVTLHIDRGEMISVVGLSGSGKSTLIRTLNGLVPHTSGTVSVGGLDLGSARPRELRRLRGDIGMVFQGFNLATRTSVLNNVLVGRLARTATWRTLLGLYPEADRMLAFEALDRVGILDKAHQRAAALSGGQQQRVAIARALTQEPKLILADEPVASLDPPTALAVMNDLRRINRELGITVITNLHLMDLAREYGTRLIGMRAGEVVYDGSASDADDAVFAEIYGRPVANRDRLDA